MKALLPRCIGCLVPALALATTGVADDVSLVDGVLTFNVSTATEASPYTYGALPSGVTQIVKRGTGAVHLGSVTNAAFTGTIHIEGGFLMGYYSAFGTPTELRVEEGGALEIMDFKTLFGTSHSTSASTAPFRNAKVYICGAGPDGKGAIQRPYAHCDWGDSYFSNYLELTGDAMLNLGSRWGFYNATFVMNNHTLSFSSEKHGTQFSASYSPIFNFNGTKTIKHPGALRFIGNTRLGYEGVTAVVDAPDSNGTVTNMPCYLDNGAYVRAFQVTWPFPFKIVSQGTTTRLDTFKSGHSWGHIAGDVVIEDGSTLQLGSYNDGNCHDAPLYFDGQVSGGGTLDATFDSPRYMTGSHTNILNAIRKSSTGKFVLQDDVTLIVSTTNASLYGNRFMAMNAAVSNAATFVLKDRARIIADPTDVTKSPRLQLGFNAQYGSTGYGVLEVWDDAAVSNCVSIGFSGAGAVHIFGGTVSEPHDSSGGNSMGFGYTGYAYLGLNAGTFAERSWAQLGCNNTGRGFLVQRGGLARIGDGSADLLRLGMGGNGSFATYAQFGGTSYVRNNVSFAYNGDRPNSTYTIGTVTVDGTNTLMDATGWSFYVNANTNANPAAYTTSLVNLNNGGTLKVGRFARTKYGNNATYPWEEIREDAQKFGFAALNFDGGILKTTSAGEFFNGSATDHYREITRVTVYGAGATIDTDGHDVTWRVPLTRPFGHGIRKVTLPADALAAGQLIGPTRYWITDASGRGADMLMDFDDTNRVARGVIVTSPGCGYSESPTVTFDKANRSTTDRWTATVETIDFDAADYVQGGFTKRGLGTLSLAGASTYGGATRVEAGTLKFLDEGGYPAGSPLELRPASAISFNGHDTTLTTITGAGAIRDGNVTVTGGLTFDAADAATNACLTLTGAITFGAGSTIAVSDPSALDPTRGGAYAVVRAEGGIVGTPTLTGLSDKAWWLVKRGNALYVKPVRGTLVIIR